MGRYTLVCAERLVLLEDVEGASVAVAEHALHSLHLAYDPAIYPTCAFRLTTSEGDAEQNVCYVFGYGAPSLVDERTAVCLNGSVVFLAGTFVVCMTPELESVVWLHDCGAGSCFGIYRLANSDDFIAHCELAIIRFTRTGDVRWQASGNDIFTGPFRIGKHVISAIDYYGTVYLLRLDTGQGRIARRGNPLM